MATDLQELLVLKKSGDYANCRRTGDVLPIVYGDLTEGGDTDAGVWRAPCIDTSAYVYAVAGHGLLSAADGNQVRVFADNGAELTSGWTFDEANDYEGQGDIAILTFTSDQRSNEPLTVRCQGKDDGAGSLLTNPIDIVVDFLTSFAEVAAAEIDTTWRTRTRDYFLGQDIEIAGVINSDVRPDKVVGEMLRLLGSWWRAGNGRLVFKPHLGPVSLSESDVVARLGPAQMESGGLTISFDENDICTRAAMDYAYNFNDREYEDNDDGSASAAVYQEARYGREYSRQWQLPWIRSSSTVGKLQELVVDYYGRPPLQLAATLGGYEYLYLEPGDVVALSIDWFYDQDLLPLRNQLFRLSAVNSNLDRGQVALTALDLGAYLSLAYPADGSQSAGGTAAAGSDRDRTRPA